MNKIHNKKKADIGYIDIAIPGNAENMQLPSPELLTFYKDFDNIKDKLQKGYIAPNKPGIVMNSKSLFAKDNFIKLDVVIPAMHGMNGEDGTVQGLLELLLI